MWPSNHHQQWLTNPLGAGTGGQGSGDQNNTNPPFQMQQIQNQMLPQHPQHPQQPMLGSSTYFADNGALHQSIHGGLANYGIVPQPPHLAMEVFSVPPPRAPPPRDQQKFYCELCKIACPNEFSLQQHLNGEKHQKQEALRNSYSNYPIGGRGRLAPFHCALCDVSCRNEHSFKQHMKGDKHRKKAAAAAAGGLQTFYCELCRVTCPNQFSYNQHIDGEKHRIQVAATSTRIGIVKQERQTDAANTKTASSQQAGPRANYCEICHVSCPNAFSYEQHINGEKHRRQLTGEDTRSTSTAGQCAPAQQPIYREVCHVSCPNDFSYQQHLTGEKYQRQVENLNNPRDTSAAHQGAGVGHLHCQVCNVTCANEFSFQQHMNGKKHKKKAAALGRMGGPMKPSAEGSSTVSVPSGNNSVPVKNEEATPAPMLLPPPVPDKVEPVMNEKRPLLRKASVDDDDSEEEGEIDEEKEDMALLYDDFEDPKLTSNVSAEETKMPDEEEKAEDKDGFDSDLDDMFGTDDEADQTGESKLSSENEMNESYEDIQYLQELAKNETGVSEQTHEWDGDSDIADMQRLADCEAGGAGDKDMVSSNGEVVECHKNIQQQQMANENENRENHLIEENERDDDKRKTFGGEDEANQHQAPIDLGRCNVSQADMFGSDNEADQKGESNLSSENEMNGSDEDIQHLQEEFAKSETGVSEQTHERHGDSGIAYMLGLADCGADGAGGKDVVSFNGEVVGCHKNTQQQQMANENESRKKHLIEENERDDEMKMFEGEDEANQHQVSSGNELNYAPIQQLEMQQLLEFEDEADDAIKTFRDLVEHDQSHETSHQAAKSMRSSERRANLKNISGGKKHMMRETLDSGLGFVLDYTPDILITGESDGDGDKPDSSRAHNPNLLDQTLQEPDTDDDVDMFGNLSDEGDSYTQSKYSQTQEIAPASAKKTCRAGITAASVNPQPMTAAEALAAARSRAKLPAKQSQAKRAKMSVEQCQPVKLPSKIPQYNVSRRSYYPPVHPDKYWSEMLDWDFVSELNSTMKSDGPTSKKKESGIKRIWSDSIGVNRNENDKGDKVDSLPDAFESVAQYKALWAPLLINEAKAQLLSEVTATLSSASISSLQRTGDAMGVAAKIELSRTARDHSESVNSIEPTVVVYIQPSTKGAGIGSPVIRNDLILFVHQSSTIKRALLGMAYESSETLQKLPRGRLGFVGQALNHRSRSVDGLLARVSHKHWSQFASLDEMFLIRIGSNVTANREFNALIRADKIPLTKYLLDGKTFDKQEHSALQNVEGSTRNEGSEKAPPKFDPLALGGREALPVGFRIFIKSKMNPSQLQAIKASASEYGGGGFTLIKGPPGTGKSTTLCSILNALHLRQYQEYYSAIEKIVTESNGSSHYEELAALNKAAEVKPRILVCAPSNAGIDNVIMKIMGENFVDGQGTTYSPSIVRVGMGITNEKVKSVGLKQTVDSIVAQGLDVTKLEDTIATGRQNLKRLQNEIHKIKIRIKAMIECCPYEISSEWEIRIDEASFESSGRVLFVNHSTKTATFDIPSKVRPHERPCILQKMPHYVSLLKSLTKYVERHNNVAFDVEKYAILQNAANARLENGGTSDDSLTSLLETHVLNSTHIILTTLGSAGGRAIESANKFKVVVIDEAAQSAEPSTLVALQLGSCHAILVGDPQQLPTTIFSISGRSTKYDRSLFQRLEECGHDVHLLNTQYRMNPVISEFPRHIFYGGMLLDGPNVQQNDYGGSLKTKVRAAFPYVQPFNIFDLDSKEEKDGTSLSNKNEAQLVLQLYRTLDRETDGLLAKTRVAVITPYSQQSSLLHRLFEERYGDPYSSRVEISTVDAFQGREAGIVIYSCVRAGRQGSGIGFLSDIQRMNVALTRAKHFLFVIARRQSIAVNPYWRKLIGYALSKSAIIHVPIDTDKRQSKTKTLRSSFVKSHGAKKARFGGVSKHFYEVDSKVNNSEDGEDVFPNLTHLAPMHNISIQVDGMNDNECSPQFIEGNNK